MSEPAKPAEPEPGADQPSSLAQIMTAIDERIAAALGKLFDTGKADVKDGGEAKADPAPGRDRSDVTAAVKAEVAKLKEAEQTEAAKKSMEERIAALEEAAKKALEAPPEEFRKVTERMWR